MEKKPKDLAEALRLARTHQPNGISWIYQEYFSRVLEIVRIQIGPALRIRTESTDILEKVFLTLISGEIPKTINDEFSFLRYVTKCVLNEIRDEYRYQHRSKRDVALERSIDSDDQGFQIESTNRATASEILMGKERYARYIQAIDGLGDSERQAILLARHFGVSSQDAARVMGLASDASFRAVLSRALARVALSLGIKEEETA